MTQEKATVRTKDQEKLDTLFSSQISVIEKIPHPVEILDFFAFYSPLDESLHHCKDISILLGRLTLLDENQEFRTKIIDGLNFLSSLSYAIEQSNPYSES